MPPANIVDVVSDQADITESLFWVNEEAAFPSVDRMPCMILESVSKPCVSCEERELIIDLSAVKVVRKPEAMPVPVVFWGPGHTSELPRVLVIWSMNALEMLPLVTFAAVR